MVGYVNDTNQQVKKFKVNGAWWYQITSGVRKGEWLKAEPWFKTTSTTSSTANPGVATATIGSSNVASSVGTAFLSNITNASSTLVTALNTSGAAVSTPHLGTTVTGTPNVHATSTLLPSTPRILPKAPKS